MEKKFAGALRALILFLACSMSFGMTNAQTAPDAFAEEGISKAVAVINEIATKIDALERAEDAAELQNIMNSIKFRNVRKKYGKIELTDAYRDSLAQANFKVLESLKAYITRASLPYELQEALEKSASKEVIVEELKKSKTLREAML